MKPDEKSYKLINISTTFIISVDMNLTKGRRIFNELKNVNLKRFSESLLVWFVFLFIYVFPTFLNGVEGLVVEIVLKLEQHTLLFWSIESFNKTKVFIKGFSV